MKITNTFKHLPTPSPSKVERPNRPDNGAKNSRGTGPSSESYKDNSHSRIKLETHAC